ncbi:MAG: efflux RND transporter periplasmic adaptor subunit [Acidobacteria bacterium]|nr:efflux RND transporter periplasmic adaptor subunit [Acidobacteriota bacterium]MBI3486651.1 efflux RND transporter periplasmic adaptor subunit [Acidobacteriota bacterium]
MQSSLPHRHRQMFGQSPLSGPFFGFLAACLACGKTSPIEPARPPLVRVCAAEDGSGQGLELRGVVASEGRLRLGFKASGIIAAISVREGQAVLAGKLLAVLDGLDARSGVQTAKAELDRVRREAERAERLVAEGVLPSKERSDARNALESAEARWCQAQDALARTRLAAPVAGTIFQRLAEPGETVATGTPILELDTTGRPVIRTGATERELSQLQVGQQALLLPEDGAPPFKGRVRGLGAAPAATDGLYSLTIVPGRTDLRPGTLLKVRFEGAKGSSGVRIPFSARVHRQGRDLAFVLEGTAPSFNVKARPVEVAKINGTTIELRSGLKAGERLVAEGAHFLEDGQAVRILE